jgi:predicted phosphate transport protein (TIGR00153 family)
MLKFLIPKEEGFFEQFDTLAALGVECAAVFVDMLEHYERATEKVKKIHDIEHLADDVGHRAAEMLHKTFITPFDREQILTLISRMDDVIDLMHSVSNRLVLYGVTETTKELREMASVLQRAVLEIQKAVKGLRNLKNIEEMKRSLIQINKLENDGDALRDAVVGKLFKEGRDAIEVFKWKEIYEDVETAIDRCEDVADVIEGVLLENA